MQHINTYNVIRTGITIRQALPLTVRTTAVSVNNVYHHVPM